MRVLLLAHACGPNRGSEPGTAWNLAWELSATHQVWVITHPQHRTEIEAYLLAHPRQNLSFVYVSLNPRWDTWDPKRGEKGLKLHYIMWQRVAAREAVRLCREHAIDIAHHVSLGTINAPPLLHKLPVPTVWGPLGGGQLAPLAFKDYFRGHVLPERARHVMAALLPLSPMLRRVARRCSLSLAKNQETLDLLRGAGAKRSQLLLDCGLPSAYIQPQVPQRDCSGTIELLWAGRLEQRKAPRLAIEAIVAVGSAVPLRLTFVGDGPELPAMQSLTTDLKLDQRVRFLGKVPYSQMSELFRTSHSLLFTSLRDSSGCVVLEAMAYGLPIVMLNHQGVACFVPDEAALKIAVTTPQQVIAELARALGVIATDPDRCAAMSEAALAAARKETWDQRAALIAQWYEQILSG